MVRKSKSIGIRDRIKELRRVKASQLIDSSKNWRTHNDDQKGALKAMLNDVGWVSTVIAREDKKGNLHVIDGHLRKDIGGDEDVPVIIVDLTEAEAERVLLTFDPLAELADIDHVALTQLISGVESDMDEDAHLRKLLTDLHTGLEKEEKRLKKEDKETEIEGMPLEPHEHYDYLVVLATSTHDWNVMCERLGLVPRMRRGRMGTARAIKAEDLVSRLKTDNDDA